MDEIKNEALNLDLSKLKKKRIIVDGDSDRVLYLDLSDMNMLVRLKDKYEDLSKLQNDALEKVAKDSDDETTIFSMADALKEIDTKMREIIDYIFDGNVSEVCAPFGNMFDFIDGKSRYEHVFDALVQLYGDHISAETKKIERRVNNNKHTNKYVK